MGFLERYRLPPTGLVTFDEPLDFDHLVRDFLEPSDLDSGPEYGGALDGGYWWGDGGSLAPEVGLLTRSIVIQGVCVLFCLTT